MLAAGLGLKMEFLSGIVILFGKSGLPHIKKIIFKKDTGQYIYREVDFNCELSVISNFLKLVMAFIY